MYCVLHGTVLRYICACTLTLNTTHYTQAQAVTHHTYAPVTIQSPTLNFLHIPIYVPSISCSFECVYPMTKQHTRCWVGRWGELIFYKAAYRLCCVVVCLVCIYHVSCVYILCVCIMCLVCMYHVFCVYVSCVVFCVYVSCVPLSPMVFYCVFFSNHPLTHPLTHLDLHTHPRQHATGSQYIRSTTIRALDVQVQAPTGT